MNTEQELLNDIWRECQDRGLLLLYSQARKGGSITAERSVSNVKHRMHVYSVGKSITALGVGIAESEKLLSLDDRAIDYFDEYKKGRERIDFKIKDLLRMTSGLKHPLFFSTDDDRYIEKDWVDYFWRAEFDESETSTYHNRKFLYSNFNTYILSCIIEKVSGESMLEYLRYRLFEPIGIQNPDWTYCPKGHTYGCNGVYLNIDEIGYLGELILKNGCFDNRQIVPREFVEEAVTKQVDTSSCPFGGRFEHGYGYGIWMTEIPDVCMCYGSCGQFILIVPKQELVLSFLSFDPDRHLEILDIIIEKIKLIV